jgi:branched-chain amino acid transport system substrate-binding protein
VIRIGVGQPLSGELAAMGQDMVNGARMAVDTINAAGGVEVDGRYLPLELVTADDRANAEAGVRAAQALVAQGVVAVIAHLNSGVSIAAAPVYAQAQIPQLAISTNPRYTRLALPTTLRLVANDEVQARAMAGFASSMSGAQRFALVDDGSPFGKDLGAEVARLLARSGQSLRVQQSLDGKTTDFLALTKALKDGDVQVLITTLADFQIQALMQQLVGAGLSDIRIVGADNAKTEQMLRQAVPIRALYATSPIISPTEIPTAKPFLRAFQQRYNNPPNYAAHYAHDAVMVVADAIRRNGSLDQVQLLRTLKTFDGYAPVLGQLRMKEDGEQRYGSVGVYRVAKGQWELQVRTSDW